MRRSRGAAEEYVALDEREEAVITYTKLAGGYPDSPYWNEAVLRIGKLLEELEEPVYAARFYRRLMDRAPGSAAAESAESAFEALEQR